MFNANNRPDVTPIDVNGLQRVFTRIYGLMAASILVSLFVAYTAGKAGFYLHGMSLIIAGIVWIAIPIVMQFTAVKHPILAFLALIAFVGLAGLMMSYVFVVYTPQLIVTALVAASSVFIIMSIIGLTTKKDVSHWGVQLSAMLIAVIVASVINIFLHSSVIELVLAAITIVIFTIMTMVDTARIKTAYQQMDSGDSTAGLVLMGCLSLFLDFINLFLRLLEIFAALSGNNNDN